MVLGPGVVCRQDPVPGLQQRLLWASIELSSSVRFAIGHICSAAVQILLLRSR